METPLIITDVTRMNGTRVCVAGINQERKIIRPILPYGIMEDWLYLNNRAIIRPFARVHLDLLEHQPHPPHTEDYSINPDFKIFVGLLEERFISRLLDETAHETVLDILGPNIKHDQGFFIPKGEGERSLGTLRPREIEQVAHCCYNGKWDYRISFNDFANHNYRLSVTDLAFRYHIDDLRINHHLLPESIGKALTETLRNRIVYLRIGLARNWEKFPDRCYLQITGVYTFPDYLDGKCFADFRPQLIG